MNGASGLARDRASAIMTAVVLRGPQKARTRRGTVRQTLQHAEACQPSVGIPLSLPSALSPNPSMPNYHFLRRSRPPSTAGVPHQNTSHMGSHASLARPSSAPPERPPIVQPAAGNAPRSRHGHVKDDALDLAVTITGLGKDIAGFVSVPGLDPGLSALLEVLNKIQVMSETAKGVGNLRQDTQDLVEIARDFATRNAGKELPKSLQGTIDELTRKWTEIEERATKLASRNKAMRFIRSSSDAKKLEDLVVEIGSSIQRALLRGGWDVQLAVAEVQQKLDAMADQQDEKFIPPHVESATYDAKSARPRETCLEGTREDILENVWTWVKLRTRDLSLTGNTQGQWSTSMSIEEAQGFIHWTCGLAGTGKTTIACSVAKRCKEEHILGGSFFFSRFDSQCDNPRLLFTSISCQLCRIIPAYKTQVIAVMKENPDIASSVAAVQFEKLILEPLEQLPQPFLRMVIVIDALDECRGDDSTSTIFHILLRFKDRVARFFLLIMTSRPEPDIVAQFDQSGSGTLGMATKQLVLHTVELEPVLRDIGRFLTHHLKGTMRRRFPPGRPSDADITALATLSEGLFIFARTTVNLLTDKRSIDPVATLERIAQRQSHRSDSVSILNELYRQVLDEAHPDAEEEVQDSIRRIVGTLVVAAEPLSVTTLAALLGLSEYVVRNVLSELYSVLHIPDKNSDSIHFIHPTFPEFLLQASSSVPPLPPRFSFEAAEQHCSVFVRCLTTTKVLLQYDIAGLRDPCIFKKEVPDLSARIQERVPAHLSYACRNWIVHFTLGGGVYMSASVHTLFSEFLHHNLLYWLEVSSLLNTLNEVPAALDAARHTCQSLEGLFTNLVPFLLDARRFTLTYAPCVDSAPLQVYHSALALAPRSSVVSRTYSHARRKEALAICRGALPEWGPVLDSLTGHSNKRISAVAFSPDNAFFVSGGDDGMVKVWQASTRILVLDIQTSIYVEAVAYSPSGLHIAVGGRGGLSIWHAASGAQVRIVTDDSISHVAYTADGSRLLSVSNHGKIQLWRVSDGECLLSLDGEDRQADISPDGAVIAFVRGASVLLHDVSSSKHEALELPEQGKAATFSSDGRYVAAVIELAVRIWSHQDKSLLRSLDIKISSFSRLSFSPDGSRICCGCRNGTVLVWPVEGDGPVCELKGYPYCIADVAWSPDGSQIISASADGIIWLWDVINQLSTAHLNTSSDRPSSGPPRILVAKRGIGFTILDHPPFPIADLLLSSNDDSVADSVPTFTSHPNCAAAWDHVVHTRTAGPLWERDYCWAALTGQNEYSSGATTAISNDGSLVAYAVDRHICIHNLTTGELVTTLTPEFESGGVYCIVFSPDDCLLASGTGKLEEFLPDNSLSASDSRDHATVAVWNITAGACVAYHNDHLDLVRCVTFSSNGRFVVSGSFDKTARVYDISAKQVTHVLEHHDILVMQMMLTTDDRLLIIQDFGGLYIWNIETGSRVALFPLSDEFWITTLHFSPTGFTVSTEDGEQTVELWKAGHRAWPVYYVSKEGWVYAKGPGYTRRLAWLPTEWRYPVCSDGATFCVCEVERGGYYEPRLQKLIELDMSGLLDHVGILYTR